MIKNYTIIGILFCAVGLQGVQAETYETVATGTFSWMDPLAWIGGDVPPDDIHNHDSVIINNEVVLMTSLGIKNGGVVQINGLLVIYNPNGGIVVENKGKIVVDGTLRILPGVDGTPNSLVHDKGEIEVNGLLENIGAELTNEADIYLNTGGIFRNYGYRDATDDLLIQSADENIYNLYVFAADLFGYSLDPGSLVGGTGGPDGGGTIPDSMDYGSLVWTCYAGTLNNEGEIISTGGEFDYEDCGGGIISGDGSLPAEETCQAPENLRVTGSNRGSGLTFRWDAVETAHGYIAAFKPAGAPRYRLTRPVNGGATSISFARNYFPAGISLDWAILTVCEPGEIDMNFLAIGQTTQVRMASTDLEEAQENEPTISLYPNPAAEHLFLESRGSELKGLLSIFDINGRLVLEHPVDLNHSGEKMDVALSDLVEGLYLVKVNDGNQIHQESLLVTR